MKRAVLGPIAALLLCCTAVNAASRTLTVLQWNVFHGGRGTDARVDVSRQVNWIAAKHPDIASLNEVSALQAEEYRQRLEAATEERWYSYHVAAQADGTGNQILSRHPFVSTDFHRMRVNGEFRRAVAQATVDIDDIRLNVFSTHLDHSNGAIRQAQIRELIRFVSRFPEPSIVAGDLNAPPDAAELLGLGDRLIDTWSEAVGRQRAVAYPENPPGHDTRTRATRVDYILHSPGLTTVQAEIPDQRDWSADRMRPIVQVGTTDDLAVRPSDHNFLFVVFGVR